MTAPSATTTFAVALNAAAGAPADIALLPAGKVAGRDGREWTNDAPAAVVAAFRAGGIDLPIDIEHATDIKGPKGEPAPAQGWITGLNVVAGGAIRATVEWTDEGAKLVASRAYRYISPAFLHARDGRVLQLIGAGLTNRPNLSIPALNSRQENQDMDRAAICATLGLVPSAADPELMTALNRLKAAAETPDPQKFVPRADLEAALNRATTAEQTLAARDKAAREAQITALIDGGVAAGKIAPASKEHYVALCREAGGLEAVTALLASLPSLTAGSGLDQKKPAEAAGALTETERAFCRQYGIAEKDFLAARDANVATGRAA